MVIKELIKNFLTFYKNLFLENVNVSKNEVNQFLSLIFIPEVTGDQSRYYGFILSEKYLLLVLKSLPNNKSSNDLTKEFYEVS